MKEKYSYLLTHTKLYQNENDGEFLERREEKNDRIHKQLSVMHTEKFVLRKIGKKETKKRTKYTKYK